MGVAIVGGGVNVVRRREGYGDEPDGRVHYARLQRKHVLESSWGGEGEGNGG